MPYDLSETICRKIGCEVILQKPSPSKSPRWGELKGRVGRLTFSIACGRIMSDALSFTLAGSRFRRLRTLRQISANHAQGRPTKRRTDPAVVKGYKKVTLSKSNWVSSMDQNRTKTRKSAQALFVENQIIARFQKRFERDGGKRKLAHFAYVVNGDLQETVSFPFLYEGIHFNHHHLLLWPALRIRPKS